MKKNITNITLTFIGVLVVLQSTGCAFGTRKVSLGYTPDTFPPSVSGSPSVLVYAPKDVRHEQGLGCVRNAWGMKTAKVETKAGQPSPSTWIAQALSYDLERAGCSVVNREPTDGTQPDITIGGALQRVYVDSYMSLTGEISLDVYVKNKDRIALNRNYRGEGRKINWWASSGEFQQTLDLTLQNLMKQMLPEITAAISKKYEDLPPAEGALDPVGDKLSELKQMKNEGLITEEEYEKKKEDIINAL